MPTRRIQLRIRFANEEEARAAFDRLMVLPRSKRTVGDLAGCTAYVRSLEDGDDLFAPEEEVTLSPGVFPAPLVIGLGPSHSDSGDDCLVLQGRFPS